VLNPMNLVGLLLLVAVVAVFVFLIRRGGTSRTIGLGLLILLTWLISCGVISAFWYEREGNLNVWLISLLALIPTIVIGTLASYFSRHARSA